MRFKQIPRVAALGAIALIAIAAVAISSCGDDDDNDTTTAAGTTAANTAGGNEVDRAFIADMTPHHESAIEMAKVAQQKGESEFVMQLAGDIITSQSREIDQMAKLDSELAAAGVPVGELGISEHMMGMSGDMHMLETAKPFDPVFLEMMIPHHEGAIRMAKVELADGENEELMALAQSIIDAQTAEIEAMRGQLDGESNSEDHGATGGSMDHM